MNTTKHEIDNPVKPQDAGWTIRVSETLKPEGGAAWFSIGRFWNGVAEDWRCYFPGKNGGRFKWRMPKTNAEAQKLIRRYPTRGEALSEAMRIGARDGLTVCLGVQP